MTTENTAIPTDDDVPLIDLSTLCKGAAMELFDEEFQKVLANVQDPNTEWSAKRSIRLDIVLDVSDETRNECRVDVSASSKLAAFKGASGTVFIGRQRGKFVATAYNAEQMQLMFDEQSKPRAVRGEGGASQSVAQ